MSCFWNFEETLFKCINIIIIYICLLCSKGIVITLKGWSCKKQEGRLFSIMSIDQQKLTSNLNNMQLNPFSKPPIYLSAKSCSLMVQFFTIWSRRYAFDSCSILSIFLILHCYNKQMYSLSQCITKTCDTLLRVEIVHPKRTANSFKIESNYSIKICHQLYNAMF